jgi:hypothetical protein
MNAISEPGSKVLHNKKTTNVNYGISVSDEISKQKLID